MVELARADVQHSRLTVDLGQHTDQLQHELRRFQGTKYVLHGNEQVRYEGVQLKGEFDDCLISLCLANWGREHGWRVLRVLSDGDPASVHRGPSCRAAA